MFQAGHSAIEMFQGGCSDHAWSVSIEILILCNIMYLGFFSMGLAGASWVTDFVAISNSHSLQGNGLEYKTRVFSSGIVCNLADTLGSTDFKKKRKPKQREMDD